MLSCELRGEIWQWSLDLSDDAKPRVILLPHSRPSSVCKIEENCGTVFEI